MIARIHKSMQEKDKGFTLIELLVVMIIIGILAAIAIPVFLNQRTKAQDSATKADVSTIGKEVATFYVDNTGGAALAITSGRYVLTPTGGTAIDLGRASDNVAIGGQTITGPSGWTVCLTNSQPNTKAFSYSQVGGLQQGATCSAAGAVVP